MSLSVSYAQSISRMDQSGGSMSKVPVMDQGNLGICYSYSATQMFDAFRFSHGDDSSVLTSSIEAAIGASAKKIERYYNSFSKEEVMRGSIDGGEVCEVVNYLKNNGICSQTKMQLDSIPPDQRAQLFDELSELFYKTGSVPLEVETSQQLSNQINCIKPNDEAFPELKNMQKILDSLKKKNVMEFLNSVLAEKCNKENRIAVPQPTCVTKPSPGFGMLKKEEYADIISKRLEMNEPKQPISIGYCAGILRNGPGYRGIKSLEGSSFKVRDDSCGYHQSLIIGQKDSEYINPFGKKIKMKQYLVRNTWGKSKDSYHPGWESEEGNIWVNADDLLENIDSVSYLEDIKKAP